MRKLFYTILAFMFSAIVMAGNPQGFSYQAVIRDTDGQPLAEQEVSLRITLQHDSGTPVHYAETHALTTSPQGVVSLAVGNGTAVAGEFDQIPWSETNISLKVEVDIAGGTNFAVLGITKLQAVPYALYALSGTEGPQGEAGADGVGISSVVHNADGTLTINLTDDNSYTTEDITGPKGEDGADGAGIASIVHNAAGTLTITLTDDTSYTTDDLTGPEGPVVEGTEGQTLRHGTDSWEAVDDIFVDPNKNVGIGTVSPSERLEVAGNVLANQFLVPKPEGFDDLLFAVRNSKDEIVFAVYESGVRIYVDHKDEEGSNKSTRSGFAIGGLTEVGKEDGPYLLQVNRAGTTVRFDETGSKSTRSGFAIGGLTEVGKAIKNEYLTVTPANTTVRFDETAVKSTRSGFAIGGLTDLSKQTNTHNYMSITPENYFIGHNAGANNTSGRFNSFIGFQSGKSNTIGHRNVFIGYETGLFNIDGSNNIFIGNLAGRHNIDGFNNVILGNNAGYNNVDGYRNVFIGVDAGGHNTSGALNTFVGNVAGRSNISGFANTAIGNYAGYSNEDGGGNVFLGQSAGWKNKSGDGNVYIGSTVGYNSDNGMYNTSIGYGAGYNSLLSESNVIIGGFAGYDLETSEYNIFIGYRAGRHLTEASNRLIIDSYYRSDIDNLESNGLILGEFDASSVNQELRFNSNVTIKHNLIVHGTTSKSYGLPLSISSEGELIVVTSDINQKQGVADLVGALARISKLKGVIFIDKTEAKRVGLIAQDVEKVLPEAVFTNPIDGRKGVHYEGITTMLIESIKEQQEIINNQQKRIDELYEKNQRIESLEAEIEAIKALINM